MVARHVLNNYFRWVHSFGKAVEGHRIPRDDVATIDARGIERSSPLELSRGKNG